VQRAVSTRFRALLVALATTLPTVVAAQQPAVVIGTVRDTTGRPLAGAVVAAHGTARAATTDTAGRYRLAPLGPGRVVVEARMLGHRPARDSVTLSVGDSARIDFALAPSPLEVAPVVVTAAKRSQLLEEAVTSVAVVERSDLLKRAVNTVDEAVDRAPGVQFVDGQVNIRGSTGYSRGLGSRVLLLVDGVPANQGDRGGISWDLLPVDEIERVEVVKGAGSALYGSAALGGVVNLITRDLPMDLHWRVRAMGGAYADPPHEVWRFRDRTGLLRGIDVSASYGSERIRGRVAAGGRRLDGYREQDVADHFHAASRGQWRSTSGASRLDLSGAWAVDQYDVPLEWCVRGQCEDLGQAYQPFKVNAQVRGEYTDSRKGYLTAQFERATASGLVWSARGSWLRTSFVDRRTSGSDRSRANRIGGELRAFATRDGGQTVTAGLEGSRSDAVGDIFSGSDSLNVAGTHTQGEYAAYGESEMPLAGARLTVGGRIDFLAVDGGGLTALVSPRVGLVKLTRTGAWRASAGRGFRAPQIAERFVTTEVSSFRVIPNPGLEPETAWSVEVGNTRAIGRDVVLDAAIFWVEARDFIEPALLPSGTIQFQNLTRARLRGLDASVAAAFAGGRLRASAAYLFLDARELAHDAIPERPLNFRSRHLVTLAADYQILRGLTVGGDARSASRVERVDLHPDDERIPARTVDLRLAWDPDPFGVRVLLANALNYIYNQVPRTLAPVRTLSIVLTWTR
jgi:iron complex outermembrane receptor protein